MIPFVTAYVVLAKATLKQWFLLASLFAITIVPYALVRLSLLGAINASGNEAGYASTASNYFQISKIRTNIWGTILNSRHYRPDIRRQALLQAAPWLVAAPIGVLIAFFKKRHSLGLCIFFCISAALALFYLSGYNMSDWKLQYHCLRYISPAFIALNLGLLIVVYEAVQSSKKIYAHAISSYKKR